jgi:hypothetical protein
MTVIPEFGRQKQEDLQASLGYIGNLSQKKPKNKT